MKKLLSILLVISVLALFFESCCFRNLNILGNKCSINNETREHIDGPFVFERSDSKLEIITAKKLNDSIFVNFNLVDKNQPFTCYVDNNDRDFFNIKLIDSLSVRPARTPSVEKLFVMSDLHGSFNSMSSLLINNGVIDDEFNWTFGDGHLVMIGDVTDRGENTIPCLWLLYHLEEQVKDKVHYLLGNHELMNLYGRTSYLNDKTKLCINKISGLDSNESLKYLFSNNTVLGKWLRTKNTIEQIGDYLFVHAGISNELVDSNLSLEEINNIIREYVDVNPVNIPENDEMAKMLFGRLGPIWYRGMVMNYQHYYKKMSQVDYSKVLSHFKVKNIFVGHSVVKNISSDYNTSLIRINVSQPSVKNSKKAQALLIEGENFYRVNAKGEKMVKLN